MSVALSSKLRRRIEELPLPEARIRGTLLAKRGDGRLASKNFLIKAHARRLECNDFPTLQELVDGTREEQMAKHAHLLEAQVDDAGGGCPIGGVMVGVYTDRLYTDVTPARYFKSKRRNSPSYLLAHAQRGRELLSRAAAEPDTHRVSICPGWINGELRDRLRQEGYRVDIAQIEGPLQEELEAAYAAYLGQLGFVGYVDPKEAKSKREIAIAYKRAVDWGWKYAPHELKTMFRGIGTVGPKPRQI